MELMPSFVLTYEGELDSIILNTGQVHKHVHYSLIKE